MNVATISWLDATMIMMLVGSIGFGFHQGLLRQIVLLVALYVGTVLSAQYYERLYEMILSSFPSSIAELARVAAFLALLVAFTAAVTYLLWSAYQQTRLPLVFMLDEVGGAALGGLIGVFVIGISLTLAQYAVAAPWPIGNPIQYTLHMGLLHSSLDGMFSSPLPLIQATLRPWLPSGIPLMLGS